MLEPKRVSIYELIYRRFLRQSLIPFLLIFFLIITLFALNARQSTTNRDALEAVATKSFEEIANQTSSVIIQRFGYDKLRLYQLRDTFELLLKAKNTFALDQANWRDHGGFFIHYDESRPNPYETSVYTTNLLQLHADDMSMLSLLQALLPSIRRSVDEEDDLITAAWVNIDKYYALAYPAIVPTDELSPELDVTEYAFYYQADPEHNPSRDIVYLPLYQEPWAVDAGELGAFLIPLYDGERFIGVIGLTLSAKGIAEVITNLQLPFDAYAQLVDDAGYLIAASDEAQSYRDYERHSFYELHRHSEYADRSLMKIAPTAAIESHCTRYGRDIEGTSFRLNIQAQNRDIFRSIDTLTKQTVIVGIVLSLLILVIYLVAVVLGVRSIRELASRLSDTLEGMVRYSSMLGRREGIALQKSDISELDTLGVHLRQTHQKLLQMVIRDEQTGLFNLRKLKEDVQQDEVKSLMIIRLRNYKTWYNLYGSDAIDVLIHGIVAVLKRFEGVWLYRIGEDEFALLGTHEEPNLFREIVDAVEAESVTFASISLHPQLYAGLALQKPLLERASLALLSASQQNAATLVTCKEVEGVKALFESNLEWANRFNAALRENRLLPWFQPIFNMQNRRVEKFEALVRMIEGDAVIAPVHFLQSAANMGKGHEITRVMIQKVFAVAARYREIGFSINISFHDFLAMDLPQFIEESRQAHDLDPSQITFELLESDAIAEPEPVIAAIGMLKQQGYHIAIDDFGTGHSNFAHLMLLQCDYIKIDGQFVKHITTDSNSETIARTIARFSDLMGAQSVAEFVADSAIFEAVAAMDIKFAQGYAISPPQSADAIGAMLGILGPAV